MYNVYFDAGEARMTVMQLHPDSASLELHMELAAERFRGFGALLELETMDVFGAPSEKLLMLLRRKAQLLGGVGVGVHAYHAGFTRFAAHSPA